MSVSGEKLLITLLFVVIIELFIPLYTFLKSTCSLCLFIVCLVCSIIAKSVLHTSNLSLSSILTVISLLGLLLGSVSCFIFVSI